MAKRPPPETPPDSPQESPPELHRAEGPRSVGCAVLTVSDTRDETTDTSGKLIREMLVEAGHKVLYYEIVRDEAPRIGDAIAHAAVTPGVRALLISGGTGIAPRDVTHEVIASKLEKKIDGFGELFRQLSYEEIGPAAMLSRAVAGTYKGTIIFSIPGSRGAVRLALEKLILPELGHAVGLTEK